MNPPRTQAIGAAAEFLGCDRLIAPSARWDCDNLMLYTDRLRAAATLARQETEAVDWARWGREHGFLGEG